MLWTAIKFKTNGREQPSMSALTTKWIEWSKGCGLSVGILAVEPVGHESFIDTAVETAPQWERLRITTSQSAWGALAPLKSHLCSLRQLDVWVSDCCAPAPYGEFDTFSIAPQLHRVRLNVPPSMFNLPWSQLTHCWLEHASVQECRDLLQLSPRLVDCTIVGPRHDPNTPTSPEADPIVTHLRTLAVRYDRPCSEFGELFQCLSLPSIEHFVVDMYGREPCIWPQVLSVMSGQSCRLTSVALVDVRATDETLFRFLSLTPALRELEIGGRRGYCKTSPRLSSDIFRQLAYKAGSKAKLVLPMLQTLRLWGLLELNCWELVNMVESRWRLQENEYTEVPARKLRSVDLQLYRELDSSILGRLRELSEEGLQLFWKLISGTYAQDRHADRHWAREWA